jgi:hypothetical protein
MGLLDFLFGKPPAPVVARPDIRPTPTAAGPVALAGTGDFDHEVVGESFYQDALDAFCGGKCEDGHDKVCSVTLIPEPTNQYDKNAVAVLIGGKKVAHLSREDALDFHADMRRLGAAGQAAVCRGRVNGGWRRPRKGGEVQEGHYGVELDLDWPLRRA